jgi:DNA-binding NarL/FixJ family response regulator
MSPQQAKRIIEALANGIDPDTGEVLPGQSVFNNPQVVRSLFVASKALDAMGKKEQRQNSSPQNAGKAWSEDEERAVVAAFNEGHPVSEIAAKHGRTNGSIASRLVRLGCITEGGDAHRAPERM